MPPLHRDPSRKAGRHRSALWKSLPPCDPLARVGTLSPNCAKTETVSLIPKKDLALAQTATTQNSSLQPFPRLLIPVVIAAVISAALGTGLYLLLRVPILAPSPTAIPTPGATPVTSRLRPNIATGASASIRTIPNNIRPKSGSTPSPSATVASYALLPAQIKELQDKIGTPVPKPLLPALNVLLLGIRQSNQLNRNTDVLILLTLQSAWQNSLISATGCFRLLHVETTTPS